MGPAYALISSFVAQGLEAALVRRPQGRPSRRPTPDGRAEAHLVALACSKPPGGRGEGTMPSLADRRVELPIVDAIADEAVRRTLQKAS